MPEEVCEKIMTAVIRLSSLQSLCFWRLLYPQGRRLIGPLSSSSVDVCVNEVAPSGLRHSLIWPLGRLHCHPDGHTVPVTIATEAELGQLYKKWENKMINTVYYPHVNCITV